MTAEVRARLDAGEWAKDERLPGVKDLATQHHTSRATMTKALHALADEGLLTIVPSWGVFRA